MKTGALKIAVLGGGSWGTALVHVLQHNGFDLRWWVRREGQKEGILSLGHNPDYLSYTSIDRTKVSVGTSLAGVAEGAGLIFLAIPSAFLSSVFAGIAPDTLQGKAIISAVKGIEPSTLLPVHGWLRQELRIPPERIGVIGGPCHSEEVAMQRLSYLTLGVYDLALGEQVRALLENPFLKVQLSDDVEGIGIASVLKNVYGILAGIANGLRYGDNFQAVLVSNAIREMESVLMDISGNSRNINDSVYAGDLLVTSYSGLSRNWMLGSLIGKGYPVKSALLELRMVAEGYFAAASFRAMPGFKTDSYPLLHSVVRILHEGAPADQTVQQLTAVLR